MAPSYVFNYSLHRRTRYSRTSLPEIIQLFFQPFNLSALQLTVQNNLSNLTIDQFHQRLPVIGTINLNQFIPLFFFPGIAVHKYFDICFFCFQIFSAP